MIIVDTGSQRAVNKREGRAENQGLGPQTPPPPPPYNSQPSPQPLVVSAYYPVTDVVIVYRESPARRFWKAFGVAVLIWFLFFGFTKSFSDMVSHHYRHSGVGEPPRPEPHDGTVHQLIAGSNWTLSDFHLPRSAETFLELPADSDAIYLFTRGPEQSGHVNVVQSTAATNKVGVKVRVNYWLPETLDHISVCHLERRANEHGIGIITSAFSRFPPIGQRPTFYVDIVLPAGQNGDVLHIKSFETETSNYGQDIADIWETVSFDRISLKTSNGHVTAKSITAESGVIRSSNGAIQGHFNSGSSIDLTTSNAGIRASVTLLNRENGKPSELKMKTSNGGIDAKVELITHSGQGGIFNVGAQTSNGGAILEYLDMPVNAVLVSNARTSNAAASVKLHSAFEGSFEVNTSNGAVKLQELPAEDPSGLGRRRVVKQTRGKTNAHGSVYWGEGSRGETEGRATVKTSNGRVELVI